MDQSSQRFLETMTQASALNDLGSDSAMTCAQLMCLCDGGDGVLDKHCNMNFFCSSCVMVPPDFPDGSDGKASAYNVGDPGSVPGSGRSPREGNGNPLWYFCLENPMDGGAWWATVLEFSRQEYWGG